MKKTLSFMLALCLMLSLLPVGAYASETEPAAQPEGTTISGSADISIDVGALPDGEEVLDRYAQTLLYPQYSMMLFSLGPQGFEDDVRQQYIYTQLKEWITKVANGTANSHFTLDIQSGLSLSWSIANELDNAEDSVLTEKLFSVLDIDTIIDCLIVDMPYELYWLGKSGDNSIKSHIELTVDRGAGTVSIYRLELIFQVGESYKDPNSETQVTWSDSTGASSTHYCYKVNAEKRLAAEQAVNTANQIVNSCQGLSDYQKLLKYKEEICALTDYNRDAVATPDNYGDPWQIIYVFDGNKETNVVCEGYSKAFQYLCDLSTFDNAACYTAIGTLSGALANGSSADHMWNIVRLEGNNYLVDVTNSDIPEIDNQLFLAGTDGNPESGYSFQINGSSVHYAYNLLSPEMKNMMKDVLRLSASSYDPEGAAEPEEPVHEHQWSAEWRYDDTHHWHDCTADGCGEKNDYAEHQFGEWTTVKEATATEDGSRERHCACGDKQTQVISATGGQECQHEWKENKVISEASCEQEGLKQYICEQCGETETKTIAALGHEWGAWEKYSESDHMRTCTHKGCTATETKPHEFDKSGVCKDCGYVKQEPHEHSFGNWEPLGSENHIGTCTHKGCTATETKPHEFDDSGVCKDCGYIKIQEPQPTEHQHIWPDQWKYADETSHIRNCTEVECGEAQTEDHIWDDGEETTPPTTTSKGIMTYTCIKCGAKKTQEIPMLEHKHSWSNDWTTNEQFHWHACADPNCSEKSGLEQHYYDSKGTVTKAATTTSAGTIEYKCTVCGQVKIDQIPILPSSQHEHKWSSAWTYNNTNHWHECTASGCSVSSNADKYGYAAHSFGAWRTVREATATTEGLMEHQCGCGYKETKTIPVKTDTQCSHNWSDWVFKSPNYWERSCSICNSKDIKIAQLAQPKIISGANAVWRQGSSNGLSFTSDAPVSEFMYVYLNGFKLNEIYYTVTEGSTIVTLTQSCLEQLGVGTHTLAIESAGGTAQTSFTVKARTILNNQTPTYNSNKPWTTPKTGDSANMGLWIGMIAVCVIGMGGVALYVVKAKKNKRR